MLARRPLRMAVTAAIVLALGACGTLQHDYTAVPSSAFDKPQDTTLGRAFAAEHARNSGHSAFRLINRGVSALLTRAALADLAERAIDIQYYVYDVDEAGVFLMQRLVAAADRGVRVRLLLDDLANALDDATLAKLDAHPNIEIRVFNPFRGRARWTRAFQLFASLDRLGRRMHNKVFAVDGHAVILGGRNIGNRYFEAEAESHFRDLDVLALGPVARSVGAQFDAYWNSELAAPVSALGARPGSAAAYDEAAQRLASAELGPQVEYARRKSEVVKRLLEMPEDFIWAKGTAVADTLTRVRRDGEAPTAEVMRALRAASRAATREMLIQSAYFVPGARGVETLSDMVRRGIRVRVLTNSLLSTDVPAVHAGYARYRRALLEGGVELYEYRVDSSRPSPRQHSMRSGRSESALHSKVMVFDQRVAWIGSANLDPRSRRLNTESGMFIESEELAARLLKSLERDFAPENSWRVELIPDPASKERRLVWRGMQNGRMVELDREPGATLMRGIAAGFYSLFTDFEDLL
jgi:cardiolipin synthase C